jgi:hypothetical protein
MKVSIKSTLLDTKIRSKKTFQQNKIEIVVHPKSSWRGWAKFRNLSFFSQKFLHKIYALDKKMIIFDNTTIIIAKRMLTQGENY